MNTKLFFSILISLLSLSLQAETIDVTTYKYAGPFVVRSPFMADSTDVNSKAFSSSNMMDYTVGFEALEGGKVLSDPKLPGCPSGDALHLVGFNINNSRYTDATINVSGIDNYQLYVDGKKVMTGYVKLDPSSHQIAIKYLTTPDSNDSMRVSVECDKSGVIKLEPASKVHNYNFWDVIHGTHFNNVGLSPSGKYLIKGYLTVKQGGRTSQRYKVVEVATGRVVAERTVGLTWMPRSEMFYYVRDGVDGKMLVAEDPATGSQSILASDIPAGSFVMGPTESYLIYNVTSEGPKEDASVYEVIEPDDRQPGWRERNNLALFDLNSGVMQPLTFGHHNIYLQDISADGKQILFIKSESRLTSRPTTVFTLYKMNLENMQTETLIVKDGFIDRALFSPDASQVLVSGSPECLNGIGINVDEGQTPSMIDKQLYLLSNNDTIPLTRDFDPSVTNYWWNAGDGRIYFTAEDRDSINMFRLDPKTREIKQLDCNEEVIMGAGFANRSMMMAYYGCSASNSDRLYTMSLKTLKPAVEEDLSSETLKNVHLGECHAWTFTNSRGETVYARYYLPADFDASKKYPMIVNYYGGCSPTSRNFESRYPHHAYASLGYVVLVINPSGATGFGQKWSARHVDTAGEGVAQDIIDGTIQFCREHSYVNDKKIGCIGASYGGFMTQYLQTVTDIFAAAISHAGISDHTSYWGEGYWGYSYSEVSMANRYPWTDRHLYVDQSPLYNADKIHTPILFLHGDADTNVPVGESIQMYTALKLLGRETAMVLVKDQNHHILDYQKRIKWQNTIFAWFAKYLQDDDSWWESLYPKKDL